MSDNLSGLSAIEIADGVKEGKFSAEDVVQACLERIEKREDEVMAWEFIDPDIALSQARALDAAPEKGLLAGVPVGIKDIIDTGDMPTGLGSPIYDGYIPPVDATCVARLRSAGAVILGKTVTCEFAGLTPRKTANPLDPLRTPGGSSSGSSAAVADSMMPIALGTQTGGSVLRPSSYCGIIGFKPSFDTFSLKGVFPAAESLDTLGLHARCMEDIEITTSALLRRDHSPAPVLPRPPVVGLCKTWMWEDAQPETRAAVENAVDAIKAAGGYVRDLELPEEFQWLGDVRGVINARERASAMAGEWATNREQLSDQLRKTVQDGIDTPYDEYVDAMYLMETCRARMNQTFEGCEVLLAPAVDGEAPLGLDDTGSPKFQAFWTMLHVPTITLPSHKGPNEMPVGIQLIAPYRADQFLMAASRWVLDALAV
ncbi:MAG: amidase [Pseudomonadota bacterium]|nr:amidase [Pseudomonadota bacterium]